MCTYVSVQTRKCLCMHPAIRMGEEPHPLRVQCDSHVQGVKAALQLAPVLAAMQRVARGWRRSLLRSACDQWRGAVAQRTKDEQHREQAVRDENTNTRTGSRTLPPSLPLPT